MTLDVFRAPQLIKYYYFDVILTVHCH